MIKNYDTWKVLDSDWLETRYAPYLPPEPEDPCLSKCLVIKPHYDDVIMLSFFFHILAVHVRTRVCEYTDAKSLRPCHLTIGSLSNDDGVVNENDKKAIGLDWHNNNFALASRFFVHFFPVSARLRRENA